MGRKKKIRNEEESILSKYLKEINSGKKISKEAEDLMLKRYYKSEDAAEKDAIKKRIVEAHQLFIYNIAKMYGGGDESLTMDLMTEGTLGMYETFDNYDITKKTKFLTYAVYYIKRKMLRFMDAENMIVRPSNNAKLKPKVKRIEEEFYRAHGRKPNIDEIEDKLMENYNIKLRNSGDINGVTIERLESPAPQDMSDEATYTFEVSKEFNDVAAVENDFEVQSDREYVADKVNKMISNLPAREEKVIRMAYGIGSDMEPCGNDDIAEALDMSPERVRQIIKSAQKKLRAFALKMACFLSLFLLTTACESNTFDMTECQSVTEVRFKNVRGLTVTLEKYTMEVDGEIWEVFYNKQNGIVGVETSDKHTEALPEDNESILNKESYFEY